MSETLNGTRNLIVISDTHCGCRLGLCCRGKIFLDGGGHYVASRHQLLMWGKWEEFWNKWVPMVTRGEPFAVLCNGDAIDGVHHGSTTQISHNLEDQGELAYRILSPVVEACEGQYYHVRGTEAHVGQSGVEEERLAKRLGAIPNEDGQFARNEVWFRIGKYLVHALHHIGTTGVAHGETAAPHKEITESFTEAARWGYEPPDVVVRSHRHRFIETRMMTEKGFCTSCTTPAWQLKTPFAYRIAGARQSSPQLGGTLVRAGDEDIYTRHRIWSIGRTKEVKL